MKRIVLALLFLQTFNLSCGQNKKLGYEKLNLETVDFSKKIDDYYSKKKFLQVDTYEIDFDSTDIATTYLTLGDSLTYFGNTYFNGTSMMVDDSNRMMALKTVNRYDNLKPLTELMTFLSNQYGKPKINERDFFRENITTCYWPLKDRMILVNSVYNTDMYHAHANKTTGDDNVSYTTELYIVKREYQDRIIGKINHGDWMSLGLK